MYEKQKFNFCLHSSDNICNGALIFEFFEGVRKMRVKNLVPLFLLCSTLSAAAYQVNLNGIPDMASNFAGGYVALSTTSTGTPYTFNSSFSAQFEPSPFSFHAVFDTGADSIILSNLHKNMLGIPSTGETYTDTGIGGTEVFDVSSPTYLRMAPITKAGDSTYLQNAANYTSAGQYKLQLSRNTTTPLDVIGAPLLNQHILRVNLDDWKDASQTTGVNIARTELLSAMPTLPTGTVTMKIPLQMIAAPTGQVVSTGDTPFISGITIRDDRKAANLQSTPKNWLFDTGAQVTVISQAYAQEIGINLATETPVSQMNIGGVGTDLIANGYKVDQIIIPDANGNQLIFNNSTVFVPQTGSLPGNISALFGMNLLSGEEVGSSTLSNFKEWYYDGINKMLTLIPIIPGDLNDDGSVNVIDLGIMASYYGTLSGATRQQGDLNGDGIVDVIDLGILSVNYGVSPVAGGMNIPEPASIFPLICGTICLMSKLWKRNIA